MKNFNGCQTLLNFIIIEFVCVRKEEERKKKNFTHIFQEAEILLRQREITLQFCRLIFKVVPSL
jgi:hypothetical protein